MDAIGLLKPASTLFVMIDIQERLVPVMQEVDRTIANAKRLIEASRILRVPLVVTEQNPKKLGKTVLETGLSAHIEKTHFSCFGEPLFSEILEKRRPVSLVLFGMEAHVCVLKTALDARAAGYQTHVVADAVSSRSEENMAWGLDRMRQSGVFVVPTETVLFQLLDTSGTPEFRAVSALIK